MKVYLRGVYWTAMWKVKCASWIFSEKMKFLKRVVEKKSIGRFNVEIRIFGHCRIVK